MFRMPKYGVYFLSFIILSKIIYLFVEMYYNGHLIDVVTTANITVEMLESLEKFGHNVSSVGLTLLITPFFYLLFKMLFPYKENFVVALSTISFMTVSFFTFHTLLVKLMDDIVEQNKDKRYNSYYISSFKYGLLTKRMGYETFIPKESLENLSTQDKLVISNLFLLNYIDDELTDKLITNGQESFVDMFIEQYGKEEYKQAKKEFDAKASQIASGYNEYILNSKKINEEFAKIDNKSVLDAEYIDFTNKLRLKYKEYEDSVIKYENSILISNSDMQKHYDDLAKYFRYQKYDKAKKQYRDSMYQQFGEYIEPSRWCSGGSCPTKYAIKKVIKEEAYKKFVYRSDGLPPDLGQRDFFKHKKVKSKVVSELRYNGLDVAKNFNYSKSQFAKAYKNMVNKEFKKAKDTLIAKIKDEAGVSVDFGLSYNQFVYKFKSQFIQKYGKYYGYILYKMVLNKDTSQFYEKFYKQYFKNEYLKRYLLSKKDFEDEQNAKLGNDAIKHLYIPPFAIAISLLAGILNFVSVVTIILFLVIKTETLPAIAQFGVKLMVKILLFGFIIWYPFHVIKNQNILQKYKDIEKVKKSDIGRKYVEFIEWMMVYEKINYESLYSNMIKVKK